MPSTREVTVWIISGMARISGMLCQYFIGISRRITLPFDLQITASSDTIQPIARSEFGLWIFHRGALLFDRTSEYARLLAAMRDVDDIVAKLKASSAEAKVNQLVHIKNAIGEMNSLVDLLFDRSFAADNARDPLTQLLNRKFVETLISAEIGAQKLSHHPFSILLIEIPQFDDLRVRLGRDSR